MAKVSSSKKSLTKTGPRGHAAGKKVSKVAKASGRVIAGKGSSRGPAAKIVPKIAAKPHKPSKMTSKSVNRITKKAVSMGKLVPEKPRRALTSYMVFANRERKLVQKQNPGIAITDIARELGRRWSSMDDVQRTRYEREANKDRERYQKERMQYEKKIARLGRM